jgi:hypothetical protein
MNENREPGRTGQATTSGSGILSGYLQLRRIESDPEKMNLMKRFGIPKLVELIWLIEFVLMGAKSAPELL